jgi:hypothetical protein
MVSSRPNLGKYRSIAADDRAGTELAPLMTVTPAAEASVLRSPTPATNWRPSASHGVVLPLKRACRVNQNVDVQPSKDIGQLAIVSVKRHCVFNRQGHRPRSSSRAPEIPATDQDSERRGRSKRGGDAVTKESIAAQHEDRVHQTPMPLATLKDRAFPEASVVGPAPSMPARDNRSSDARTNGIGFVR